MRKILKFYFFVGNVAKACSSFAKTAPVHLAGAQQAQADWDAVLGTFGACGTFPANFKRAVCELTAPVGPTRRPVRPADEALFQAALAKVAPIRVKYES